MMEQNLEDTFRKATEEQVVTVNNSGKFEKKEDVKVYENTN